LRTQSYVRRHEEGEGIMSNLKSIYIATGIVLFALIVLPGTSSAQCFQEPPLQNHTGAGAVGCPCFIEGEQAGVILDAPAAHYPLEILRIGIGWGSMFGGSFDQVEQAIHVYAGGLPDPGTPFYTLLGPVLHDGVVNDFNIEPLPGEVIVSGGPFTVALEFLNTNAGNSFAPTVVHDGNGCQGAMNVVFAIPGGWYDACTLGVTGDWVMYVVYKPCAPTGIDDGPFVLSTAPAFLQMPRPNPFASSTEIEFVLERPGIADVSVFDVGGRRVTRLVNESYPAGAHRLTWAGRDDDGGRLPSGVYFVRLQVGDHTSVQKIHLTK
jgi:hypothetical protein